jgi:hypothetical protein
VLNAARRQSLAQTAKRAARERSSIEHAVERYYAAFDSAKEHCLRTATRRTAPFDHGRSRSRVIIDYTDAPFR